VAFALSTVKGPEPIGAVSNALAAAASPVRAFGTILMTAMRCGKRLNGALRPKVTVWSSVAVTVAMKPTKLAIRALFAGSSARWNHHATSAAVTAEPSENFAPARSFAVQVRPSALAVGSAAASAGYGCRVIGSRSTSASKTCWLTAVATALEAFIGSKPLDRVNARVASMVLPPVSPVSLSPQAPRLAVTAVAVPSSPA